MNHADKQLIHSPSTSTISTSSTVPAREATGFLHLRLHSEFSISDSIVRLPQAVQKARECAMPALALTDLANCFGLLKFYNKALDAGIKPIVGADCWILNDECPESPHRLLLLVKNQIGYQQLCELISLAYSNPERRGLPQIDRAWFAETGCHGLIALSGGRHGDIGEALLGGDLESAKLRAHAWSESFPDAFYIEVQRYGQKNDEALVAASAKLAVELDLPVVATHPIQFMSAEDFQAHEVRVCIAEGSRLGDQRRQARFSTEQYFKTPQEMAQLFADLPEALANTVEIARRCNFEMRLGEIFLPDFPMPPGVSLDKHLESEVRLGFEQRLIECFPAPDERERHRPGYESRLASELRTITDMGFSGYFLIVADFINWAKKIADPPIPVGPGRGSGAGSLVAYALGITELDPIPYALLFERFLNPERISMPDFDIDFCQEERWRVIEYVRERYGKAAVSQIVTFGTMASKAVIRDVGRVLDLPYSLCDRLSKLVPVEQNKPVPLQQAMQESAIQEMLEDGSDGASVQEIFELGFKLEDLTRNVGIHAGGMLITPGKITDFCPVYRAHEDTVSQFDKDDVEKAGLVKFDFLGLRNLTIIEHALDNIKTLTGERPVLASITLEDRVVYDTLKNANTIAVFQLESEGMKKLLKNLRPDRFEDIIAVLALYRPGPLRSGMVDDFVKRKNGLQKIDYFHPDLKTCLEPTYGVVVYQEQVMQISQIIGGYTLGEADLLRRAMSKKKADEMAQHLEKICDGAERKGYERKLAKTLFELMDKFAEYGFNKSHTAAYALITYHTAWLKAHHLAAFMAATLSSDMDNTDTVKLFYDDARMNALRILPPDINASTYCFIPVDTRTIRYGLGAVKGVGRQAVEHLVAEREKNGNYTDLFEFCRRVDKRFVNRRAIEALIRTGAFDDGSDGGMAQRATLAASLELAMDAAEQADKNAMQTSLFEGGVACEFALQYTDTPPWTERERLYAEKQALGFYLSGHPFDAWRAELSHFVKQSLGALQAGREPVLLAGIVSDVRKQMTRRGKMAVLTLDDGTAQIETTVFDELYRAAEKKISVDDILLVEGRVVFDDFSQSQRVTAEALLSLSEARSRYAQCLILRLAGNLRNGFLQELLDPYRMQSGCPVVVEYQNQQAICRLQLGKHYQLRLDDELMKALSQQLGAERFTLKYA